MEMTAVEWLVDQIENEGKCIYEVIEQAKEMEKEQIIEAYCNGDDNIGALEYYHETFKTKKND